MLCMRPAPEGAGFFVLDGSGEGPGPILSEAFSKPMGRKKLVWWEYPIRGHAFYKFGGVKKLVWWENPILGHVLYESDGVRKEFSPSK